MVEIAPVDVPAPAVRSSFDDRVVAAARDAFEGRTIWHVNTTAVGGGVAELLRSAITRHEQAGIRARWLVMKSGHDFFGITKQLHHFFHGSQGDGRELGDAEFGTYQSTTRQAAAHALRFMTPGDVVLLHDPQTLGMAPVLRQAGMRVAWRSHIGTSSAGPAVAAAWRFLAPFLAAPLRTVFSLPEYVPSGLTAERVRIIAPAIDETSDKCRPMAEAETHRVLAAIGLVDAPSPQDQEVDAVLAAYTARRVRVWQDQPLGLHVPALLQLARWDPLKDMAGTLTAFVRHIAPETDAHLVLAGPDPADIADDPENLAVFDALLRDRAALPEATRRRVHLVALGLADDDAELRANALVVNALQRHASVIAQKSLEEGFGLAVAEAMWKSRPVVASAVGGIRKQMTHEVTGLLVDDPADLATFGRETTRLLRDAVLRGELGQAAHDHCAANYLAAREFRDLAQLYLDLDGADAPEPR